MTYFVRVAFLVAILTGWLAASTKADMREIKMLPAENWWGIGNNFKKLISQLVF